MKPLNTVAVNLIARRHPPPMNIGFNELGIDSKRKVLYRNFHEMSSKIYLVEISRDQKKVFILLFPDFDKPEEYISEVLTEKIAGKLMKENKNLFEKLIQKFFVKFNKLQIQGYHTHVLQRIPLPIRKGSVQQSERAHTVIFDSRR